MPDWRLRSACMFVVTLGHAQDGGTTTPAPPAAETVPAAGAFRPPCEGWRNGLHGGGNFGVLITRKTSPFVGSHHLAEDGWLPSGTEVHCIAAGIVRYSAFSPTFTDARGQVHWNLGNVVVVEHRLDPPIDGLSAVCSVYVHLGSDRRVAAGDRVELGSLLGTIGADRSEENGRYPAHLHFGLHRGPYLQIPPSWRRELEEQARTVGIVVGQEAPLRGEIEFVEQQGASVLVRNRGGGGDVLFSLLMGNPAPPDRCPPDIALWCSGYGSRAAVDEWLCPSRWIALRTKERDKIRDGGSTGR